MSARGYTFDPLDRGGLLFGLGPAQLVSLSIGGVLAIAVGHLLGGTGGVAAGLALLAGVALATCWPVQGRPPLAWVPVITRWLGGRRVDVSPVPGEGIRQGQRRPSAPLPAGVALVDRDGMALVHDRPAGAWVGVLAVQGRSFPLLDPAEQRRRLAAWGALLAGLARPGSPVVRIQWVVRTTPADPALLRRPDAPADYAELIESTAANEHRALLAVAVRARRSDATATLGRELRLVANQARSAELDVGRPLTLPDVEASLAGAGPGRPGGWPLATRHAWSAWRGDGVWHATFWVAEWPRVEVGPELLAPLVLADGCRAVALTMAPTPTARAVRRIESARTASLADEELRRRAGFVATARRERRQEGAARREAELADGHAEYRFSGYVTVSAATRDELAARCAQTVGVAEAAGLVLRRLWGQQAEAFTWTLPLARGLA